MKKLICYFLALVLLLSTLSACRDNSGSPSDISGAVGGDYSTDIRLAYCANDSFNPYKCRTAQNRYLSSLLFDPLVRLREDCTPEYCLAEAASVSGDTCTVTLRSASFSDGSSVTAEDVIYSAQLALSSKSGYAERLYMLDSLSGSGKTVVFKLKEPDINFVSLLDFPIIKKGTAELYDESKLELPPVGCGHYAVDVGGARLVRNAGYYGAAAYCTEIPLVNVPDDEALSYAIRNGNISLWYDPDASGSSFVLSGGTKTPVINNLVYIGINHEDPLLSLPEVRYMLNAAVARAEITNDIYEGLAVPSYGIFNPSWAIVSSIQGSNDDGRNDVLVANSKEIGYNSKDAVGYFVSSSGKRLSFTLIYCNEKSDKLRVAERVAEQMKKCGIEVTVKGLAYDDYITALESKAFQLYLAETSFRNNMDVSSVVCTNGAAAYGLKSGQSESTSSDIEGEASEPTEEVDTEAPDDTASEPAAYTDMDEALKAYNRGELDIYGLVGVFELQLPVIPVCYRCGILSCANGISGADSFSPSAPYSCVNGIKPKEK